MGEKGGWQREVARLARTFSSTVVIGALSGAVIGGLGGRLAMRVLFITSDDSVKGLESDDGFEIGRFTLVNTLGLMIVCAVLGIIAAMLYLVAQPFVANLHAFAVPVTAVFYAVVGGAAIVNPDGVDFTALEPVALAIVMFVAICGAFGAIVCRFVNRAVERAHDSDRPLWLYGPPLVVLLFPPISIVTLAAVLVRMGDATDRFWRVLRAGAYGVMGMIFVLSALNLVSDTARLT